MHRRISLHRRDLASNVTLGARDYDPFVARWLAKDPIVFASGDANLYAYSGNDPINRRDPNGRIWIIELLECWWYSGEAADMYEECAESYQDACADMLSTNVQASAKVVHRIRPMMYGNALTDAPHKHSRKCWNIVPGLPRSGQTTAG